MSDKEKIKYQTLEEYVEKRFFEHPEEVEEFLQTVFEEYEKDPDEEALLAALRQAVKANGDITELAEKTGLSREILYKTLSRRGSQHIRNFRLILQAFGYTLSIKPMKEAFR